MSEAQYIEWSGQEGVRSEWVDGKVLLMNAVVGDHADLTTFVTVLVGGFVAANGLGKVWTEPFQMRLPNHRRRRSADLFYASTERLHLFEKTQFNGAPDLVVEVISPDSQNRDRREKFLEYQTAGVREYWIPDPISRTFDAFTLSSSGKFELISVENGQVPRFSPDCTFALNGSGS